MAKNVNLCKTYKRVYKKGKEIKENRKSNRKRCEIERIEMMKKEMHIKEKGKF